MNLMVGLLTKKSILHKLYWMNNYMNKDYNFDNMYLNFHRHYNLMDKNKLR